MVKVCSPFEALGVVDSSFKWTGGGLRQQAQADETHGLWKSKFSSASPAKLPCIRTVRFSKDRFSVVKRLPF